MGGHLGDTGVQGEAPRGGTAPLHLPSVPRAASAGHALSCARPQPSVLPRLPQDPRGGCLGPSAGHISATATYFQAHSPYN